LTKIKRIGLQEERVPMPDLLVVQVESFKNFLQEDVPPEKRKKEGLQGVFLESFPIEDIHGKYVLEFVKYRVGVPKYTPDEAKRKNLTYSAPLWATFRLLRRDEETGELRDAIEQEVYLCDIPYMASGGTFIINGIERVVVNQLHRSPGVYYELEAKGLPTYRALLVPYRGPWVEFTIDGSKMLGVTISKRRKIPITRLLRALGFPKTSNILKAIFKTEKVKVSKLERDKYILAEDVVDRESGELIFEAATKVDEDVIEVLKLKKIKDVTCIGFDNPGVDVILATLKQDRIKDEKSALGNIYRTLRYTPPKDEVEAKNYIESFFFSPAKFYLGRVGRYKLNSRLKFERNGKKSIETFNIPQLPDEKNEALTKEDLISIVQHLLLLYIGEEREDDVDDLAHRRVRRVGELLYEQFRISFLRLSRVIKERMLLERDGNLTPKKMVNPRLVTSSILSFFTGERLSQFLDQTNPLAELTHKRRLSALGKGGLTRETAGFEVRDVHPSHYGRLCPIETPEGQNIGLITSLTTYARIDEFGFIRTPLIRVKNGQLTGEVVELTPYEEENYRIASADTPIDPKTGKITAKRVWVRYRGGYPLVSPKEVDFIDVSPRQVLSPSATLIPFIEHDDANRALMGCNMQRQAVPLLISEPPIVGTGMEAKVARDSGAVVIAKKDGVVREVDSSKIVIEPLKKEKRSIFESPMDVYNLLKFNRSNQNTCLNQRPLVKVGDKVKAGDIIADGPCTKNGELSLGKNLLVAFLPWFGYNFEDAIVVSENVIKEDVFTSIHILEFEVEVRETKLGPEEVTRDLPNVSEEALKNLDENGIVRIGAEVKPDDILVGKVSPKGERELSPEEKLIYAIFAEKAKDVRDTSRRVPPGVQGVVVDVIVLSRRRDDPLSQKISREKRRRAEERAWHAELSVMEKLKKEVSKLLDGETLKKSIKDDEGKIIKRSGQKIEKSLFDEYNLLDLEFPEGFIENERKEKKFRKIIEEAKYVLGQIEADLKREIESIERGDELPPGVLQLIKVYVAQKRKLQVGDKLAGRHGNKGVVAKIAPVEDMPFLEDGTPVDIVLNPLGVPSRMNVGQILETILGWAGKEKGVYYASPVFQGLTIEEIEKELKEAGLPPNGKVRLRDGRTGEYMEFESTVGYIYMMKLVHMVEDKVHARATGPYSLITQQPVGGKSHFGGQRFGEMEVWALEAYGAAYTLQEMITVKSDDIKGRNQLYQAIIKGEEPPEPGLPASFDVLLKELRGLALDVEIKTE
jgi:DNA-directed RNA polymerase subunit beta